jgi:L-fuculose-phosphate aldolase
MESGTNLDLEAIRHEVASASNELAAAGLAIGTGGNVSARVGELVAITPTGAELAGLMAGDVTVVDLSGEVVNGGLAPTSELDIHLGVYRRYGAGAVIHTHPPVGTALSCVLDEVPCIHYQMLLLGGDVRVAPYRTFGTPELAQVTLDALEGKSAALMANHGAIAFGHDLAHAVKQSLLLEWACQLYSTAAAIGVPRAIDENARKAVLEAAVARNYGSTQRI